MGYRKSRTDFLFLGVRHHSRTISIESDIGKMGQKILIGKVVQCNRKKSISLSDNTIHGEGFRKICKTIGKAPLQQVKNGYKCKKNPTGASENRAKIESATASKKIGTPLSTIPGVIFFFEIPEKDFIS